jgi:hypothetical protein
MKMKNKNKKLLFEKKEELKTLENKKIYCLAKGKKRIGYQRGISSFFRNYKVV